MVSAAKAGKIKVATERERIAGAFISVGLIIPSPA
jgi:hypothetical protein